MVFSHQALKVRPCKNVGPRRPLLVEFQAVQGQFVVFRFKKRRESVIEGVGDDGTDFSGLQHTLGVIIAGGCGQLPDLHQGHEFPRPDHA